MSSRKQAKPIIRRSASNPLIPTLLTVPDLRITDASGPETDELTVADDATIGYEPQLVEDTLGALEFAEQQTKQLANAADTELPPLPISESRDPETATIVEDLAAPAVDPMADLAAAADLDTDLSPKEDLDVTVRPSDPTADEVVDRGDTWFGLNLKRDFATLGTIAVTVVACAFVARLMQSPKLPDRFADAEVQSESTIEEVQPIEVAQAVGRNVSQAANDAAQNFGNAAAQASNFANQYSSVQQPQNGQLQINQPQTNDANSSFPSGTQFQSTVQNTAGNMAQQFDAAAQQAANGFANRMGQAAQQLSDAIPQQRENSFGQAPGATFNSRVQSVKPKVDAGGTPTYPNPGTQVQAVDPGQSWPQAGLPNALHNSRQPQNMQASPQALPIDGPQVPSSSANVQTQRRLPDPFAEPVRTLPPENSAYQPAARVADESGQFGTNTGNRFQ